MQEDEIDLREYINVIIKRKWLIIGIMVISLISAITMISVMPKTYEAYVVIKNGYMVKELIDSENAVQLLKVMSDGKNIQIESLGKTNFIKIKAQANTPAMAKKLCEDVSQEYIDSGNKLFNAQKDLMQEKQTNLENQIAKIKEEMATIESMISKLSLSESTLSAEKTSQIALLKNTMASYFSQLQKIMQDRDATRNILLESNEFKVMESTFCSTEPISPKKKQLIVLSVMLGLMAGVFIVFFIENWKKGV